MQNAISGIEPLSGDHPACNVIGAQQLARCRSEHVKASPSAGGARPIDAKLPLLLPLSGGRKRKQAVVAKTTTIRPGRRKKA
jgi:hypothetical protein